MRAPVALCLAALAALARPGAAWVSVGPTGTVTVRDHTEIGYWDSTDSEKDLSVTGNIRTRKNITLTNGARPGPLPVPARQRRAGWQLYIYYN